MTINVVPGQPETSIEETRFQDYLKAYTTTGKPPPLCPATPADPAGRAAMGLPPLFQGIPIDESGSSDSQPTPTQEAYTDPAKLPAAQEFAPYEDPQERVKYQSMCCQPEFQQFSPEELRYWAYLRGHKEPPQPVKMSPFPTSTLSSSSTSRPSLTSYATTSVSSSGDQMQSICAMPDYNGHSFEELRYEYIKHHREMTSKEILASYGASPGLVAPSAGAFMPPAATPPTMLPTPTPQAMPLTPVASGGSTAPSMFGSTGGPAFSSSQPSRRYW